jgi:hypothetical protein
MNPLKEWLISDRLASECGITDLRNEIKRLEAYTSVSFTHKGKTVSYSIDEIKKRAERELRCGECRTKDLIIDGLLAELGRETAPPLHSVLEKYVTERYEMTPDRRLSRRVLLREVNDFLRKKYGTCIVATGSEWKWLLQEVVKDTSTQFRKLKLKRKDYTRPIVSNKFYKKRKWRFDKRWFQKRDKIVAVVKVGHDVLQAHDPPRLYTHPGGITAMDDINVVAVGIDLLPKKAATSRVVFYDFENPEKPKYLENSGIHRTAPADKKRGNPAPTVAITSLPSNGKRYYLLAIGNLFKSPNPILPKRSGDEIQFYKSREFDPSKGRADNPILQGNPEWTELPDFERKIADIEMSPRILNNIKRLQNKRCKKNGRVTKEECERKIALKQKSILNFQTLNFVRQCDGSLFLVGFGNKNNAFKGALKLIGKGGEDQAQLLKVDPEKMTVTLERTRRFKCDDACNFDGGAGLYLAEDRKNKGTARMIFYGSEHWPSAPGKWGKTKDFAPTAKYANIQNKVIRMNEFAPSPIDDDKS